MTIFLGLHIRTKDNLRGHWSKKAKEIKVEREAAYWAVKGCKAPPFPVKVTLTRCGPRKLDVCNLGSAFKGVVDGIADAYGVDDGDERWQFVFAQRKQSLYGIEITIEPVS
jgi:hypothetical protein